MINLSIIKKIVAICAVLPVFMVSCNTAGKNGAELLDMLPFSSATSCVWVHHAGLPQVQTDYNQVRDSYLAHWTRVKEEYIVLNKT